MITVPIRGCPPSPGHGVQISTHSEKSHGLTAWVQDPSVTLSGLNTPPGQMLPPGSRWKLNLYIFNWPKIFS